MQRSYNVKKQQLLIDGTVMTSLQTIEALTTEKGVQEVSDLTRTYEIADGQRKLPRIKITVAVKRNSDEYDILYNFYHQQEVHDLVIVTFDGHGVEIRRNSYTECECVKFEPSGYVATKPELNMVTCEFTTGSDDLI